MTEHCDDLIHEPHVPDLVTSSWYLCWADDEHWPCPAVLAHLAETERGPTPTHIGQESGLGVEHQFMLLPPSL